MKKYATDAAVKSDAPGESFSHIIGVLINLPAVVVQHGPETH
jgi:hypothetical protein